MDASQIEEAAQKIREDVYIGAEISGARLAGESPDFVKRLIEHVERSFTIDWQEQLADFFKKLAKPAGSDWSKPHRKRYAAGFYAPSRKRKPALGHIVIGVDISGSMNEDALAAVEGQLQAMFEDTKPERVTVIYCNTRVVDVDDFHGHEVEDFKFGDKRGGGTKFDPVFKAVEAMGETPDALIYFTDGLSGAVGDNRK